jgi:hypothetical protein
MSAETKQQAMISVTFSFKFLTVVFNDAGESIPSLCNGHYFAHYVDGELTFAMMIRFYLSTIQIFHLNTLLFCLLLKVYNDRVTFKRNIS